MISRIAGAFFGPVHDPAVLRRDESIPGMNGRDEALMYTKVVSTSLDSQSIPVKQDSRIPWLSGSMYTGPYCSILAEGND